MQEDIQEQAAEEQAGTTTLNFGQSEHGTQEAENGQVENALTNWEEDKRFSDHWGKDPNKMYESLKYHEKKQGEYDAQINDYKEKLSSFEDYKTKASDYDQLERLFEHPELGQQLINTVQNYSNKNNTQTQQEPNSYLQNQVNELAEWKNNVQALTEQHQVQQAQNEQLSKINDFAQKYNIQYDANDFVSAMNNSNVDPVNWYHYFRSEASDTALKNAQNLAAEKALQNKANVHSVVSGANKSNLSLGNGSLDEALDAIFK